MLALAALLVAPVAWKFALKDYQKSRIQTFLDPEQDPRGAGYQQIQARITVGSGGLTGKGFLQGTQGQYKFLPVAHNDFIFSVLAEEQGFLGVLVALGLYLFVILRSLEAARLAEGSPRRLSGGGHHFGFYVSGDLQRRHVGRAGARQGAHAAAHELRRVVDHRDARRFRPHPQRADATVHQLTGPMHAACYIVTRGLADLVRAAAVWLAWSAGAVSRGPAGRAPAPRRGLATGVSSMNKEMIISSSDHETRVAILEDDQVVEIFIERENQRGVVGNVYKGRVSKVLPGMQSSFVDIGLERDAFLYVSEVVSTARSSSGSKGRRGRSAARRSPVAGGDARPRCSSKRAASRRCRSSRAPIAG